MNPKYYNATMRQKTLYSILLVTLILSQVFFSYGQQEAQMDFFKNLDNLRNQLLEEGNWEKE